MVQAEAVMMRPILLQDGADTGHGLTARIAHLLGRQAGVILPDQLLRRGRGREETGRVADRRDPHHRMAPRCRHDW